jgi:hypothetical protein
MRYVVTFFRFAILWLFCVFPSTSSALEESYQAYVKGEEYFLRTNHTSVPVSIGDGLFISIPGYKEWDILKLTQQSGFWTLESVAESEFETADPVSDLSVQIIYADLNSDLLTDISLTLGAAGNYDVLDLIQLADGGFDPQSRVLTPKAPPSGIYDSGRIIFRDEEAPVVTSYEGFDSGTLIRVEWSFINPSRGVYNFDAIERELELAVQHDSSIHLAVLDSKSMPQYVKDKCQTFDYEFEGNLEQTCVPWNPQYQRYKRELINALGAKFDNHSKLAGVYFTYAAMSNGIEMHFRVDEDQFTTAGYSEDRLLESYNDVMDMYADAFKLTSVIMEVHEVFGEPDLAESAFEHCYDILGTRCGIAIWWCASRIATNSRESEFSVYPIAKQALELSFAVCQTIGNFTSQAWRFGQGLSSEEALRAEMNFFIGEGFNTIEFWTKDLNNDALVEIIENEVVPKL